MRKQLEGMIGEPICLVTRRGVELGLIERVSEHGVDLKPIPHDERSKYQGNMIWGEGFYPWQAISMYIQVGSSNGGVSIGNGGLGIGGLGGLGALGGLGIDIGGLLGGTGIHIGTPGINNGGTGIGVGTPGINNGGTGLGIGSTGIGIGGMGGGSGIGVGGIGIGGTREFPKRKHPLKKKKHRRS
jgi:hypothetical protein